MGYPDLASAIGKLNEIETTAAAYDHAMGILGVDGSTAAPAASWEARGKTIEVLSAVTYGLVTDPANRELLEYLQAHSDELTLSQRRQTELLKKSVDQISRIPQEEYVAYSVLMNQADNVWRKAKNENDFASFEPILEQIVAYNRKFAGYYNKELPAYDALLNEYEEGMSTQVRDAFFGQRRNALVPVIRKIGEKPEVDDSFLHRTYPVEQQRKFSDYLMEVLGIDRDRCSIAESEHPFTAGSNNHDVRITTHYHEMDLASSMYSVVHEGGHAIYELGYDDRYNFTSLAGGASMSMHESQSRFYENIIGRSRAFIERIFPKMQELFPQQLGDVTAEQLYRAVNKAEPSLIRTEADELTYSMHIMIRYELEKQLIGGTLAVKDVPKAWNEMYREYLGVEVPDDTRGCLQDMHWAGGMFGYFPTYALGSAYGAQMKVFMERDIGPLDGLVAGGKISEITRWLGERFHKYGCLYKPEELFERTCGKFDAVYYTRYLTEKFTALYEL